MNADGLKQRVARAVAVIAERVGRKKRIDHAAGIQAWENEQREEDRYNASCYRVQARAEMLAERWALEAGSEMMEREGIARAERALLARNQDEGRGAVQKAKTARDRGVDDDLELGL
ncbi:MAG: hypothetical protein IPK66_17635 [Rhodospirillales bacterium]|nr:hypothetical protein [Rhodospirillales bacterium]